MADNTNIKKFESLFSEIKRDGADALLGFIRKSDFYTAPASTRFHLSCEGGLLEHSLHVYECLNNKLSAPLWKDVLKDVSRETILIVSLLHDICKTYYYVTDYRNQKTYDADVVSKAKPKDVKHDFKGDFIWETVPCYKVDNKYPLGHGSKSVIFILQYINLTMEEMTAINHHMGAYCDSSQWNELGEAYEKYPLAMALHQADMEATHILEVENG
jgi:hypothetical protein